MKKRRGHKAAAKGQKERTSKKIGKGKGVLTPKKKVPTVKRRTKSPSKKKWTSGRNFD